MNLTNTAQIEFPFESNMKPEKSPNRNVEGELSERKVVLSERDFQVLEFILDMKFSSMEEVFHKFFKSTDENGNEAGIWYAKKRLVQLEHAGFLESTKAFSQAKRLFFATKKVSIILQRAFPEKLFPRPSHAIDTRYVVHDYLLLRLRLALEDKKVARDWTSDRNLKIQTGIISKLGGAYSPDGLYTTQDLRKVAFELEVSVKSKSRYQEKVNRYLSWMREHRNDPSAFKKVHYVVASETTRKHLETFTAMYKDYFQIEMITDYFPNGGGLK